MRKTILSVVAAMMLVFSFAAPASAATLSCGRAVYDTSLDAIVHSCTKSGSGNVTVYYKLGCNLAPDKGRYFTWSGSATNVIPLSCPLGSTPRGVTWSIV